MKIDLAQFGDHAIDVLKNGELFSPESLKFLNENIETSVDVWQKVQRGRTETELRYSVLNDTMHPTPDSKYWQVYREANLQFESLVFASYEWRESQADVEILEAEIEGLQLEMEEKNNWERKKIEAQIKKKKIELERKSIQMMSAKASAEDRVRELQALYKIRDELLPLLQYGTESPNDHQMISLAQSLSIRVAIAEKTINTSPSEMANLKGVRDTLLQAILQDGKKLNAFMNGLPAEHRDKIAKEFNLTLLPKPDENCDNRLPERSV